MGATRPEEAYQELFEVILQKLLEKMRVIQNVVHGSDSEESAKREIALWFEEK